MRIFVVVLNIMGWPLIQVAFARWFLLMPNACFAQDSWLTRERRFEQNGLLYRRCLNIQRWKGLLPDGAAWLGGKPKKHFAYRSVANLDIFTIETRRAEAAHWCMLLCTPTFYLWNPPWACVVMTLYGIAANLPCIIAQRANRMKIAKLLNQLRRVGAAHSDLIVNDSNSIDQTYLRRQVGQ